MASKHAIYISLFPMRSSYVHIDESARVILCVGEGGAVRHVVVS